MVTLDELAELIVGFPFRSQHYSEEGAYRLLRGDNIAQGFLRWNNAAHWDRHVDSRYELKVRDVVLAMDRPWISAGLKFASIKCEDLPAMLVQRVARLRAREGVDQRYLHYLIGSHEFIDHVLAVQTGTAVPHISASQILEFRTKRRSETEQRAIGEVLGALDDKIAANTKARRLADAWCDAIVKKASADGAPKPVRELLVLHYGKSLPAAVRRPGGVTVVGSGGPTGHHNIPLVSRPGVVLGRKGTVGAVHWLDGPHHPIDTTYYVQPCDDFPSEVLYYLLRGLRLAELNSDSAVPGLNRDEAYAQVVRAPAEPSAVADLLRPVFALMATTGRESAVLAATRDELLPLLMSGKVHAKDVEKSVGEVL